MTGDSRPERTVRCRRSCRSGSPPPTEEDRQSESGKGAERVPPRIRGAEDHAAPCPSALHLSRGWQLTGVPCERWPTGGHTSSQRDVSSPRLPTVLTVRIVQPEHVPAIRMDRQAETDPGWAPPARTRRRTAARPRPRGAEGRPGSPRPSDGRRRPRICRPGRSGRAASRAASRPIDAGRAPAR
jgi:hypothetical protein